MLLLLLQELVIVFQTVDRYYEVFKAIEAFKATEDAAAWLQSEINHLYSILAMVDNFNATISATQNLAVNQMTEAEKTQAAKELESALENNPVLKLGLTRYPQPA
jgi:biopolymer transport protein ExbB/TolQ